ncbi:MAG: hypothetical protein K5780_06155 [Alphaproteobacteria bacterium]|nr:hypothetical protein [Alphaproteobacteria bacterium]
MNRLGFWYFWACFMFEIFGKKLISTDSSICPFFMMGVVTIFELYILLKFPYSEKLWLYEASAKNPKCTQTRWIGLIPILAISYFCRTTILYVLIYCPLTEAAVIYFTGTKEEKNKLSARFAPLLQGIAGFLLVLIFVMGFLFLKTKGNGV